MASEITEDKKRIPFNVQQGEGEEKKWIASRSISKVRENKR
jgi:nucleoside-triphosphatase THEP1